MYVSICVCTWRLSQPGLDPSFGNLACLATLKSSDRTKQVCLWMTIYILSSDSSFKYKVTHLLLTNHIYIYIYIH